VNRSGVVTVVQARRGSTRLPGKVLLPLGNATVLECLLERVSRSRLHGTLVVATTTETQDDAIAGLCARVGVRCYRGHPTDLLDRHWRVASGVGARHVVKIPSDCPLIDPHIIDRVLVHYLKHASRYDYVSNLHPPTYPDGNDVEVMSARVLGIAWREASQAFEREHTTPFIWDQPERFRIGNVAWERGLDLSQSHRVVLDYPEDYEAIRRIYDRLHATNPGFGVADVVRLLRRRPEVGEINARYRGVNWYRHHLDDLRTVTAADTRTALAEVV
jgi:spore coat polysaccharide biosynthesis protein SpsF